MTDHLDHAQQPDERTAYEQAIDWLGSITGRHLAELARYHELDSASWFRRAWRLLSDQQSQRLRLVTCAQALLDLHEANDRTRTRKYRPQIQYLELVMQERIKLAPIKLAQP